MQVADTGLLYNGITAVLRHTAVVSLDPAADRHTATNRHTAAVSQPLTSSGILDLYRNDSCRLAINIKKLTKRKKRQKKPRW